MSTENKTAEKANPHENYQMSLFQWKPGRGPNQEEVKEEAKK